MGIGSKARRGAQDGGKPDVPGTPRLRSPGPSVPCQESGPVRSTESHDSTVHFICTTHTHTHSAQLSKNNVLAQLDASRLIIRPPTKQSFVPILRFVGFLLKHPAADPLITTIITLL